MAAALVALGCGDETSGSGKAPGSGGAAAGGADGGAPQGGEGGGGGTSVTPQVLLPKTGLHAGELAILVNDQDPQSLAVAEAYRTARGIDQVITLSFPVTGSVMSAATFEPLKAQLDAALGDDVQALAISWTTPYRVDCMALTSAFSLGFDPKYCNQSGGACGETAPSPYYDSDSVAPWSDHGIRPAMMIAGETSDDALAVIAQGLASDDSYPMGDGYMIRTTDAARSVRWQAFIATENNWNQGDDLSMTYISNANGSGSNVINGVSDVLFYFTGLAQVADVDSNVYLPGAVADHLTSFGGRLTDSSQMSILRWLEAGASGSYGTVVEPCNYLEKFPNTLVLLPHYFRGATLIEAYWKSVAWPGEGVFVGEPLARPWGASQVDVQADRIVVTTTLLEPFVPYDILGGASDEGPWEPVISGMTLPHHQRTSFEIPEVSRPYYKVQRAN